MSPALAGDARGMQKARAEATAIRGLLERAAEDRDQRRLALMRPLTCSALQDQLAEDRRVGCIHDGSLSNAITELDACHLGHALATLRVRSALCPAR